MDWLIEPLQFAFFSRALLASIIVGIVCPILGCYVILRGMAFFGDALAHTILPGVVIAFLLGWPLALGALLFGIFTALAIGLLSEQGGMKEDTAIGVVFAGLFALGVALLSTSANYTVDLAHFLFGNLLAVSRPDLWMMAGLSLVVLFVVFLFYKEFLVISFDPILAQTLHLPSRVLHYLQLLLIAITVVISLQVVGIALILAMFVTPAATAARLSQRLPPMMLIAAVLGVVSGIVGLYISFYLNIASGAAVVLTATLIFVLILFLQPGKGLLWRRGNPDQA